MALDSYSALQTAVETHLARVGDSSIASVLPDLITLFEAKAARRLRTRQMEERSTADLSTQYLALPTGFVEMRSLKLNTDPVQDLDFATPDFISRVWAGSEVGTPKVYSIIGSELMFAPSPDTTYTVEMAYYKFSGLSDSNTSNWLLESHPDAYLYGTLVEAAIYLKDEARAVLWTQLRDQAFDAIDREDWRGRWGGSPLVMRVDGGAP
jgi:hypothetical protein